MTKTKQSDPTLIQPDFAGYLPTGLCILDALWGAGMPEMGICEIRGGTEVGLSVIARQIAEGYLKRGENVAFFSVVPTPYSVTEPKPKTFARAADATISGQFDVFRRSTFGQVERDLTHFWGAEKRYSVIIVDDHSRVHIGCPDGFSDDPMFTELEETRAEVRELFLKRSKNIIDSLDNSMIILEHTPERSPKEIGRSRFARKLPTSSLVDSSMVIVPWFSAPAVGNKKDLYPRPDYAAWNSANYLPEPLNLAPLYMDDAGDVDDALSLAALLVLHGAIQFSGEHPGWPEMSEPPTTLEGLRNWITENSGVARDLAINLTR